jgi:hypothetical protein
MPRDVVNVILDRVIDQRDLIDQAQADAATSKARLRAAARKVLAAPNRDAAREAWREAFVALALAETSRHAKTAIAAAHDSLRAEARAVRALGVDRLREIPALHNADVMARRAERKGTADAPA